MLFHSLFILACFLLDGLIMILFPNSFDPYAMTFVPCLGLSALVLASRHMDKTDSLLMFLMFGVFYDFFVTREYLIYALIFVLLSFIVRIWSNHMMESVLECLLLAISTIFVKELIVYLYMLMSQVTQMRIALWLTNRLFLTLLINGVLVVVIIFASRTIEDYILLREKRIRKEESISWLDLLSKH